MILSKLLCSAVRREAVLMLLDGPRKGSDLPGDTTSNSIAAIRPLLKCGLVEKDGYDYSLSQVGRAFGLALRDGLGMEEVLRDAFFRSHDLSSIPDRLLTKIGALKGGGVVCPNGSTMRAQNNFMQNVAAAKRICGASCIHVDGYQEMISAALANGADVELILSPEVLTTMNPGIIESWQASGRFVLHVRKVKAAFAVADDMLFLALFDRAGIIDALSEWVCQSERAAEWGKELFEYYLKN